MTTSGYGVRRYLAYDFSEQSDVVFSAVLRSETFSATCLTCYREESGLSRTHLVFRR